MMFITPFRPQAAKYPQSRRCDGERIEHGFHLRRNRFHLSWLFCILVVLIINREKPAQIDAKFARLRRRRLHGQVRIPASAPFKRFAVVTGI
jgi:hypothetical protein